MWLEIIGTDVLEEIFAYKMVFDRNFCRNPR
jgi:hypothetical protein